MSQSSSDTDSELLLFTRDHQSSILETIRGEVGGDVVDGINSNMIDFSDSLVMTGEHHTQHRQESQPITGAGGRGPVEPGPPPPVAPAPNRVSAPAVNRWPGQHAFRVTVYQRRGAPASRQPPYAYSSTYGKLYTDMMAAVPFQFAYSSLDPSKLEIRAQPVYLEAQHAQTPVRRCPNHRDASHPSNMHTQHVRHVLRTEHAHFRYEEHGERCSVVVPLEPLQPATEHYEVAFMFTCMNTCTGGMNRRRLLVLFTLEEKRSGQVLGRQTLEVKVCKCPHRDLRADERRLSAGDIAKPARKRARSTSSPVPPASLADQLLVEADNEEMLGILVGVRNYLRRKQRCRCHTPSSR